MLLDDRIELLDDVRATLARILAGDSLMAHKLRQSGIDNPADVASLADVQRLPFTTRAELVADQAAHPPYGTNLEAPLESYVRVSTTRGVSGPPLRWLHTNESLTWRSRRWQIALMSAGVTAADRVLFAVDLPACWDALHALGALSIVAPRRHLHRAQATLQHQVTVVMCTPTDALRLTEAAADGHIDLANAPVRRVVVWGEAAGHLSSTRRRIEQCFGAPVADVYVLREVGIVGWNCHVGARALHLDQVEMLVESVDGELVLTPLGPSGMPLVRYRTGDLIEVLQQSCQCGRPARLVLVKGRLDERLHVRGIDLLPADIENVVRRHPAVREYQIEAFDVRGERELAVDIEPDPAIASEGDRARVAAEVAEDLKRSLGLRLQCEAVPPETLTRGESRPRRVVHRHLR